MCSEARLFSSSSSPVSPSSLLEYTEKRHNSVELVLPPLPLSSSRIEATVSHLSALSSSRIEATVSHLSELGKTAVWVSVPVAAASLIPTFSDLGFDLHHTSPDAVHLYNWLPSSPCRIPDYASHQVGCGAVCLNDRGEILVVREKNKNYARWKIPGGLLDVGEDIGDAAVREVKEETGVEVAFGSMMAVRHTHKAQFGRSDLYFICRMTAVEDSVPVAQEDEIAATRWLPFEEFKSMVFEETPHPVMQEMTKIIEQGEKHDIKRSLIKSIVPGRDPSPVYHVPIV